MWKFFINLNVNALFLSLEDKEKYCVFLTNIKFKDLNKNFIKYLLITFRLLEIILKKKQSFDFCKDLNLKRDFYYNLIIL